MKTKLKHISRRTIAMILCILMLFSTLMVGTISTANATSGTFPNGTTIYLDISDVSGWTNDSATIAAIFYYQNNDTWCVETNSNTYRDDNIGNKPQISSYKTCTKVKDNIYSVKVNRGDIGSVRFLRIGSDGKSIWNYSTRMSVDNKGTNNCVKLGDWDNNCYWSTYKPTVWALKGDFDDWTDHDLGSSGELSTNITINNTGTYNFLVYDRPNNSDFYRNKNFTRVNNSQILATGSETNATFKADVAGTYKFTFNVSTKKLVITYPAVASTYTVNVTANPSTGGTVTPSAHTQLESGKGGNSISASPKDGYTFKNWTSQNGYVTFVNANSASTTFSTTGDDTITANFTETKHKVTVNSKNSNGTAKSETKDVGMYTPVNISTPKTYGNYTFSHWTKTDNVTIANDKSENTTITATGTGTVTANYTFNSKTNYYLVGEFTSITGTDNWTPNDPKLQFSITEDDQTNAKLTLNLAANSTYKFQTLINGTYYGNTGVINNSISGWKFDNTNYGSNCTLNTTVAGTYTFTYNPNSKELSVTYPTYTATIKADANGSVDKTSINAATIVTATAKDGYIFDGWVVNDEKLVKVADKNSAKTTITPLAEGGVVTAKFVEAYSVTVEGSDYGSTPKDLTAIKKDTAVTITLPEGAGINYSVVVDGTTDYTFVNREVKFNMPANNVTITVSTTYNVTVAATTNGTVTVDKSKAAANETVTVTATPADGYMLDQISVDGATATSIGGNKYTFPMPAKATTVTVTFKEKTYKVTVNKLVGTTTTKVSEPSVGNINAVEISVPEKETGYVFDHWTIPENSGIEVTSGTANGTTGDTSTISIKATAAVTITANYKEDRSTNIKLAGNFDNPIEDLNQNWVEKDFLKNEHETTGTVSYVSVNLKANTTYAFKIIKDGTYYGCGAEIKDSVTDYEFHDYDNNCLLISKYAGVYTFKFDSNGNLLTVTYPADTATPHTVTIAKQDAEGTAIGTDTTVEVNDTRYTEITAPTVDGYKFMKWTISDTTNVQVEGNDLTSPKINIIAKVDATIIANYEVLTYKDTAYKGDVAWVDAVPDYNGGNKATLIKWNNHTGNSQTPSDTYVFYLPSKVNMAAVPIYHNFASLKIGDTTITSGGTYSFAVDTEYTITSSSADFNNKKVKFMQGSTGSTQLYLNTFNTNADGSTTAVDLPTKLNPVNSSDAEADEYKETVVASGNQISVDQIGNYTENNISKIKGRGNSSWKASCELYGKYAYNLTLDKNDANLNLFGLAGDNDKGNTKYSLLANNVDEAQVRNSYIYKLAKDLGFEYFPNFQMADLYDNGVYMGSYLVTQKVELGSKGMITEPEIKYNDPTDPTTGLEVPYVTIDNETYDGSKYKYSQNRTDSPNYTNGGTYLLEFELNDRYQSEASWFVSKQGQAIVVKSPENASQNEMKHIISKWNAVEDAVYNGKIDEVRDKIDIESFAKMYLIQELSKNLDACSTSYNILYKSAEDKFYAEPVWDYDWTLGQYHDNLNGKQLVGTPTDGSTDFDDPAGFYARYKQMGGKDTNKLDFEGALCSNPSFWADVQTIWTNEFFNVAKDENAYLTETYIDSIEDTVAMNENRWGFINDNNSSGWGSNDTGADFAAAASFTTTWITNRLTWLNGKIAPASSDMFTVKAGTGATMTYVDNMGNHKLNAYEQFAKGTRITFTAARQPGKVFMGWSTNGKDVDETLDKTETLIVPVTDSLTYTPIFEVTYEIKTKPVTYYVDMHGDSDLAPSINFAGDNTPFALTKVGTSTVYSGSYNTKYYDDNGNVVDIVTQIDSITAGGKTLPVSTANVLNKKCLETGEVWIEATNSIADASTSDNTTPANGPTSVNNTKKRVYWSNESDQNTLFNGKIYAYYWTKNADNSETKYFEWNDSPEMTKISENNYFVDVPKDANRIIFKDSSKQTVDIELEDAKYAFYPARKDGDFSKDSQQHYNVGSWQFMPADPNPKSYISKYELYVDDTATTHSIAPTLNPNATATYSVSEADQKIATVDTNGNVTPKAVGSAKVTITVTGTSSDTATVETTINVINRPSAPAAYAIMSYKSNTSSFSAVGGTIGELTTALAGSAYTGVTTGGIVDNTNKTVTYAVADPDVVGYADLAVTVTAPSTGEANYKFINWTKNGTTIEKATETTLEVALKTAGTGTDKYVANYALDSVQMIFTYNFVDYDTSNGYEYVENGPTKPASYKTAPKQVEASVIDYTDNTVTAALKDAARDNAPDIVSNYFTYSLDEATVSAPTLIDGIYYVTATLKEEAHKYKVSIEGAEIGKYYFQQEVQLDASTYVTDKAPNGYIWTIKGQTPPTPISDKKVYTLRVSNDIDLSVKAADGNEKIKNLSVINTAYHEIKAHNNKTYVGQNFYIQNFYRQDDPVYDETGVEVTGATEKTFEGAGILSYNVTTSTMQPVSPKVKNFVNTNKNALKDALLAVAERIGVDGTNNSASNSIDATSGLNYSFVKASDTVDDITGQTFMKYSQTQGCYNYIYEAMTEQSRLYKSQSYVVYSYYVYSYKDANGAKKSVYVMSDTYATAKVYESK